MRERRVGIVSDTHGLLRPEALLALAPAELIVHAGDVGGDGILERLEALAPVRAVRGNVDTGPWAKHLPQSDVVEIGNVRLYVLHDLASLDLDPGAAGFAAVVSGHTHQPKLETRRGVLHLNPGSIGPRRFRLPVSFAWMIVAGESVRAEIVLLEP